MARIYMRDYLTLDLRTADSKLIQCTDEQGGNSLLVRVAATHAGIINGNSRFYRPDMMMKGTSTWTDNLDYPRPVLAHHDEESDPLGRVLTAKYRDLSYLYRDEYPILNDSVFYCSDAKKRMSMLETVDWVVDNMSDIPDYKGLGLIELGLKVTEPDAIAKVNRKEFLTVSVGFATDSAICSVCHQDWAVDDRCDHELGRKYKGKAAYVISGSMDFNEVSFVNSPADPFATTLSIEKLTDSVNRTFFLGLSRQDQNQRAESAGIILTDALFSSDIEMLGDHIMKLDLKVIADEMRAGVVEDRALAIRKDLTEFKGESPEEIKGGKKLLSSIRAKIKANGWGTAAPVAAAVDASAPAADATAVVETVTPAEKDKVNAELAATEVRDAAAAAAAAPEADATAVPAAAAAEPASTVVMSDAVTKIFAAENLKDANEPVRKTVADLEALYLGLEDNHKRYLRYALSAMCSSWYDREEFESYMGAITQDTDMVAIPRAEHDELTAAVNGFADSEAVLTAKVTAEETAKIKVTHKAKDALATMIVMHKVLTGGKGYVGLNKDQISEEIQKRSGRDLVSLLDMRDEILDELQWAKPAAAPKAAAVTPGLAVSDAVVLAAGAPSAVVTQTDATETPAEVEPAAIPMTRREAQEAEARRRFLAASE
jgi:hypothetical protein